MNNETEAEEVTGTRLTFYCVSSQANHYQGILTIGGQRSSSYCHDTQLMIDRTI